MSFLSIYIYIYVYDTETEYGYGVDSLAVVKVFLARRGNTIPLYIMIGGRTKM